MVSTVGFLEKGLLDEMREGLRSNVRQEGERDMLDLNKDPSESKTPSAGSSASTGYFSAEEGGADVNFCVNVDVAGNADGGDIGESGEGGKEKDVENPKAADGEQPEGSVGKAESHLPLTNAGSITEDVTGNADAGDFGGGGEGGKRNEEENIKGNGGENPNSTEGKADCHLPLTNAGSIREDVSGSKPLGGGVDAATVGVVDNGASVGADIRGETAGKKRRGRKRKIVESGVSHDGSLERHSLKEDGAEFAKFEEGESNPKVLKCGQDADMGENMAAGAGGDTVEGRQKSSKGRRGRKRKILERSGGNADSADMGKEVEKLAEDRRPLIVGRVLRSRTIAVTDGEKQDYSKENAGVGEQENEKGIDQPDEISTKMEIDESTRATHRGRPKLKGRRGRPPKVHGKKGNLKVTVNKKLKLGSQKNLNLPRAKVLKGSNVVKVHKKKGTSDLIKVHKKKITHKKEGDMGRNEEKQLLRNQIIGMLKEAGWTIEYRPRMSKEYLDAVYVDCQGRAYWSVTLAYKKLKEQVEDGTADAKAISAFTPIPEEKFSKLFRITKQKEKKSKKPQKVGGSKTGTVGTKEWPDAKLNSKSHHGEKSSRRKIKRDTCKEGTKPRGLFARCSENVLDSNGDGVELYSGKRTILLWMIDMGTVSPGGKVKYMSYERTIVTLEGKITGEGICCDCCDKTVTYSDFECHAGSTLGQPFENIFLESGHSLLQSMKESWSKQEKTHDIGFHFVNVDGDDPHDDTCNICADGGDLICCDGCPSTFHHSCLQIENRSYGYWRCVYCLCKFCGVVYSGASQKDDVFDSDDSELFTCRFCEEKFHVHCIHGKDSMDIKPEDLSFCGRGCQKLFEHLQKLLGVKHELEGGYSWTMLQRQDVNVDQSCDDDSSKVICNSKLAVAVSIMDECFLPIIDQRSNINLIQSVFYSCGSNFRRLNCRGFYTFILERGDELVSAAAIRIHGNQLAEMPFIGVRHIHRRQGMCRRLLTVIEEALSSLDVEKLVIPAVSELSETWTKAFGFLPLEESKREEMKFMSMIAFPGTDMLQKPLGKHQLTKGKMTSATDVYVDENPKDKGVSLNFPTGAHETSGDINDESSPKSLAGNSLLNGPQLFLESSKLSVNTICNNELLFNSSSHPKVACLSTIASCTTGGIPEVDPSVDC